MFNLGTPPQYQDPNPAHLPGGFNLPNPPGWDPKTGTTGPARTVNAAGNALLNNAWVENLLIGGLGIGLILLGVYALVAPGVSVEVGKK